jgi:hypothetical protein
MTLAGKLRHYARVAAGMRSYARAPRVSDPGALIAEQLRNRDDHWLATARRAVFDQPAHPYAGMFRLAGCEYGDLEGLVRQRGLETALVALRREGVHLTHEELKGNKPIVRSGRLIPSTPESFANPLTEGWLRGESSGSSGSKSTTRSGTAEMRYREAYWALHVREAGLDDRTNFILRPILPARAGLVTALACARVGCPVRRWFAISSPRAGSAHYRGLTNAIIAAARLSRVASPFPRYLPSGDFSPVARGLADLKSRGKPGSLQTVASGGVRVARAALDHGWDISGSLFVLSGEPTTPAKQRLVESAGVEIRTMYWISEVGPIGWGCQRMGADCVHLVEDSVAVIVDRRPAPFSDLDVSVLLFTTLLPQASNILINADLGDSGVVEPAACDCLFTTAGFRRQVRHIRSHARITGHGMTLAGSDVVRILEEVLPARFGGAPGDFQLAEEEGPGQTQLVLRVDPRVPLSSEAELKSGFLHELRSHYGGALASSVWRHADALCVVRQTPQATHTGKVPPLILIRSR